MSSGCQKTGCTRPASKALTVNVPAKGWPIALHQPIRMVIGLRLCRQCAAETKLPDVFTDDLANLIDAMTRLERKAEPDFSRAFISPISIESDEYQNFVALRHGRAS